MSDSVEAEAYPGEDLTDLSASQSVADSSGSEYKPSSSGLTQSSNKSEVSLTTTYLISNLTLYLTDSPSG